MAKTRSYASIVLLSRPRGLGTENKTVQLEFKARRDRHARHKAMCMASEIYKDWSVDKIPLVCPLDSEGRPETAEIFGYKPDEICADGEVASLSGLKTGTSLVPAKPPSTAIAGPKTYTTWTNPLAAVTTLVAEHVIHYNLNRPIAKLIDSTGVH